MDQDFYSYPKKAVDQNDVDSSSRNPSPKEKDSSNWRLQEFVFFVPKLTLLRPIGSLRFQLYLSASLPHINQSLPAGVLFQQLYESLEFEVSPVLRQKMRFRDGTKCWNDQANPVTLSTPWLPYPPGKTWANAWKAFHNGYSESARICLTMTHFESAGKLSASILSFKKKKSIHLSNHCLKNKKTEYPLGSHLEDQI